jgi:hypothetical protein
MATCRIDPDALRDLASALEEAAARLADAAPAASLVVLDGGEVVAAGVAGGLTGAVEWCRAWSGSVRERADLVERHTAVFATPTLVPAGILRRLVAGRDFAAFAEQGTTFTAWQLDAPRRDGIVAGLRTLVAGRAGAADVATFFAELAADEAAHVVEAAPHLVGPLAGAPLEARFAANRSLLAAYRRELLARLHARDDAAVSVWAAFARTRQIAAIRRDVSIVTALLREGRSILFFDPSDPIRIAEWVGPVDAGNVAVLVPGAGADAAGFGELAATAETLVRVDGSGDLAVVAALVYAAPSSVLAAASGAHADRGGPAVAQFVGGLPIAGRHITVIGHSYGAVVVGEALRHGLGELLGPDGDVIALAAPGVRADTAGALGIDPRHVWSAIVPGDEIQLAVHTRLALCLVAGAAARPLLGACDPGEWLLHGRNPVHPAFGAFVFDADAGGARRGLAHDDYLRTWWEGGVELPTAALANVLRIATGRYDEVTPVGPRP